MYPMTIVCLVALAAWEAVEVFHHGDVFATRRAALEARGGRLADLMLCPFCLTPWVTWVLCYWVSLYEAIFPHGTNGGRLLWDAWVIALAAARVSNVLSDLSARWSRTPGRMSRPSAVDADGDTIGAN